MPSATRVGPFSGLSVTETRKGTHMWVSCRMCRYGAQAASWPTVVEWWAQHLESEIHKESEVGLRAARKLAKAVDAERRKAKRAARSIAAGS